MALAHHLSVPPVPGTSYYGELFESFVITECLKLASYFQPEFRFSYLMTADNVEIDLVIERPAKPLLLIEIKSSQEVKTTDLHALQKITLELGTCESVCFSNDPRQRKVDNVMIYPWKEGIAQFFLD